MGWVILVIICIIILVVLLNLSHRKKAIKTKRQDVTEPITDEHVEDSASIATDKTEASIENLTQGANLPPKIRKAITTYPLSTEQHKSYVSQNWKKYFEDHIIDPFPEDSPALSFLVEANKLEREGANPLQIEQALEQAKKIDPRGYELYIARWTIIKKRKKPKD